MRDFDYTENRAYFVTICAMRKLCLFGDIGEGIVNLSDVGQVVESAWQELPSHTDEHILDSYVVMPNHVHGIIVLSGAKHSRSTTNPVPRTARPGSLWTVIGGFKSAVSREVNVRNLTLARPIWQRNYYERIIRNDRELNATRQYNLDNPLRWSDDPDHPRFYPAPRLPPPV